MRLRPTTLKSYLLALPALFLGWITVLASVSLLTDKAPASVVLFPSERFLAALPGDARILSANGWSVTLASDRPAFARALYAQGAWLVLPAGLRGCLPRPRN